MNLLLVFSYFQSCLISWRVFLAFSVLASVTSGGYSQKDSCLFISPVHHKIFSSGSFGEPRSAHFHSGIDIKPHLGSGKDPIIAISDGYISRIRITPDSYGKALYIDHPCGYTSVYAHLDKYTPEIQDYIDKVRVATKRSIIDQQPPPNALIIKKGDLLGFLGNSGNSFGAHLHFEIRHTKSETPINPVLFGIGPQDYIAPVIRGLVVYELDNNRNVISQSYEAVKKLSGNNYILNVDTLKPSWPLIGFGLHVYDKSNGAGNHNGIHKLRYDVNGQNKFSFSIDSVPFDKSIFLHAHMDYDFKKKNKYVHKCYKEDLNTLNIYSYPKYGQLLIPNELFSDKITITAADIFGNVSTLTFDVQRSAQKMNYEHKNYDHANVSTSDSTFLYQDSFKLTFLPQTFMHPEVINLESIPNGINISSPKSSIPFFNSYEICLDLGDVDFSYSNPKKLTFITIDNKGRTINLGARLESKSLVVKSNDLGIHKIEEDITPPKLSIIQNNKDLGIILRITDNLKPNNGYTRMKYQCLLNKKWVPMDYDEKNELLHIAPKWLKKGMNCNIEVTDFNENKTIKSFIIN